LDTLLIASEKSERSSTLIRGKRPKMRIGPVQTSDFIFGPDIQQCMSPDFDRDRPFHTISRPISSRHMGRLLGKYGFFDGSVVNLPSLNMGSRPSTSKRPSTVGTKLNCSRSSSRLRKLDRNLNLITLIKLKIQKQCSIRTSCFLSSMYRGL